MPGKLVIMCTHGPEDPERATIPFVMAVAGQASDVEVLLGFQVSAVTLLQKGIAEHVFAAGFPPLKDLLDAYVAGGGKLYACGPCVNSRQLDVETDCIPGVTIVNAPTFVREFIEADNVLVY